jgi:hypothetical protein
MTPPLKQNCFNRRSPPCPSHCAKSSFNYLGKARGEPCTAEIEDVPGLDKKGRVNVSAIERLSSAELRKNLRNVQECIKRRSDDVACFSSEIAPSSRNINTLKRQLGKREYDDLDAAMWKSMKRKRLSIKEKHIIRPYLRYTRDFHNYFNDLTHKHVIKSLEKWMSAALRIRGGRPKATSGRPKATQRRIRGGALSAQTTQFARRAVLADKRGDVSKAIALYTLAVSAIMDELTADKEGRKARGSFKNAKERGEAMTAASAYIDRIEDLKRLQLAINLPAAPTFETYTSPTKYKLPIAPSGKAASGKPQRSRRACAKLSWSKKWCEERGCRWNVKSKKCF